MITPLLEKTPEEKLDLFDDLLALTYRCMMGMYKDGDSNKGDWVRGELEKRGLLHYQKP
jgi:hypothetical protein